MDANRTTAVGIAAIAVHQPSWSLSNDWFEGTIPRKFVQHTGIEARRIANEDEVELAAAAIENLEHETNCDLADCAGLVFASPSFVPPAAAQKFLAPEAQRQESLKLAARRLARRLNLPRCPLVGINWFCSGYSRALAIVQHRLVPRLELRRDQFVLVVNSSRISRITDYSCKQTGALFGDMAAATLLARCDSRKYPVHFELLHASAEKRPADGVYFDFHLREGLPLPTPDGGRTQAAQRLVFSLDGMGIADAAPRAMAGALAAALKSSGIEPSEVRRVVPHQAGTAIVRLTAMKTEEIGVRAEVINGETAQVGNVSSCSIPYTLQKHWHELFGTIACPTAAVGNPGKAEVSQGCVLLRSTPLHERVARAA